MRDHVTLQIANFFGLFDRGTVESVPINHFSDCRNVEFGERAVSSRKGSILSFSDVTNIVRISLYKRIGEATRILILDSSGNLYDSTNPSPILQIPGMTDFRMHVFFGRAYIAPLGVTAPLYVYDGTGAARLAAGNRPAGNLSLSETPSGNVEPGFHLFAVAYETISGFITRPGPAVYGIINATGNKGIRISNIPIGPSGTAKRIILATKSILVYDGNQEGYEFFFVPGGVINNNTDTTIDVNFFDADLVSSAEYLFDQYETLPSGGLTEYRGRLVIWKENYLYVSRPGEPESFDALSGLVLVGPGEPSFIQDCVEYRDILYVHKKFRAFAVVDNGLDPGTWVVTSIDKGVGSTSRGIIQVLDAQGASADKFLIITYRGLVLFNGVYQEPELTYKIENIWKRINLNYFHLVHGVVDTKNHRIYISVPLDSNTTNSHIIYGDYSQGLDHLNIRWSLWDSTVWNPTSITLDLKNDEPYLRIGTVSGIYDLSDTTTDDNQAIISRISTAQVPVLTGNHQHYVAFRLDASGSGIFDFTVAKGTSTYSSSMPIQSATRLINFTSPGAILSFEINSAGEYFTIRRIDIFHKPLWTM